MRGPRRQTSSFQRAALLAAICAVLLSYARPAQAQSGGQALGVDYILLIDASYSMLLDPRNPGQASEDVGAAIDEFVARNGRKPVTGELNLRSGLFKHVISVADRLLQSATDQTTVAVYAFNDEIVHSLVLELDADNRTRVTGFLQNISVGGEGTAIFTSVNEALDRVASLRARSDIRRRSTIFLFTDGKENHEDISIDEILDRFGLLRSDEEHFLFWRYYYPQVEGTSHAREADEKPELLEQLEEHGVELYDLSDLDTVFEKESVDVEPAALDVSVPATGGAARSELVLRTSEKRTEPMDLRLQAEFPEAAADGVQVRAEPQSIVLDSGDGTATLEVSLHVTRDPAQPETREDRSYEGAIRLTSPQVMLLQPSRVPVTITVKGSVPPAITAPTLAKAREPGCAIWTFFALALAAIALAFGLLRWNAWFWPGGQNADSILVVSDRDEFAERVGAELRRLGERPTLARSMPQARGLLRHRSFRLVLLDERLAHNQGEIREAGGKRCALVDAGLADDLLRTALVAALG
ncbi:MAG: VWA domain-containing protein [Chrysiogenetes bacterium]|nr:VWA domain-containing protein [Chrysiogenetes bacterium]